MAAKAVIYVHEEAEGPCRLGPSLERAGFALEVRFREPRPEDASAPLLVVMGGPMGAYEASRYPFLASELSVLRDRLARRLPNLGICLGAQLLAAAAGARVYPGAAGLELGVHGVDLADAPLFADLPRRIDVAHWHGDTFDPVPGAVLLASNERYPQQAFRIERSIGLQFHAELDAATFERWVRSSPDVARAGVPVEDRVAIDVPRLHRAEPVLRALLERIAGALR